MIPENTTAANTGFPEAENAASAVGISERQAKIAYAMVRGSKPFDEVMADFDVTVDELVGWVRDGRFNEYVMRLAQGFAQADAPYVWSALLKAAEDGSVPATRLYFDLMSRTAEGTKTALSPTEASAEIRSLRASIFGNAEASGEGG